MRSLIYLTSKSPSGVAYYPPWHIYSRAGRKPHLCDTGRLQGLPDSTHPQRAGKGSGRSTGPGSCPGLFAARFKLHSGKNALGPNVLVPTPGDPLNRTVPNALRYRGGEESWPETNSGPPGGGMAAAAGGALLPPLELTISSHCAPALLGVGQLAGERHTVGPGCGASGQMCQNPRNHFPTVTSEPIQMQGSPRQ